MRLCILFIALLSWGSTTTEATLRASAVRRLNDGGGDGGGDGEVLPKQGDPSVAPPTEPEVAPTDPPVPAPTDPPQEDPAPSDPPKEEDPPTDPPKEEDPPSDPPKEEDPPSDPPKEEDPPTDPPTDAAPVAAPVAAPETPAPAVATNDPETPAPSVAKNDGGDTVTEAPTAGQGKGEEPVTEAPTAGEGADPVTEAPTAGEGGNGGDDKTEEPKAAPTETPNNDEPTETQSPTTAPTKNETPRTRAPTVPETRAPTSRDQETPWPTAWEQLDSPTDNEDGDLWNIPTASIPTEKPVIYIPPDDDILVEEPEEPDWDTPAETLDQMEHDQNVLIALLSVFGFMLVFSIIVAHQMLNNPDGCCASICRLVTRCSCCIANAVCFPCRMMCCSSRQQPGHQRMMNDNSFSTHDLELT